MGESDPNVARRKRADLAFAALGAVLIAGSLGVLGVLIADLVRDGAPRLTAVTHLKEDGQIPVRRDVVGTLTRGEPHRDGETGGTAAGRGWVLVRDAMRLELSATLAGDARAAAGGRVVVSGVLPAPGEAMDVERIVAIPADGEKPPRIGRRDVVGVLRQGKGGGAGETRAPQSPASTQQASPAPQAPAAWELVPERLALDVSAVAGRVEPLEGKSVALTGTQSGDGAMAVADVQRMVAKSFFTAMPSSRADRAGIHSAWVGTILVMLVTVFTALPLGIGAGTYLEEYAPKNRLTALIEINIANLAGVPSIVWGLMALGLFIYQAGTGRSILTAGLTLGLLVLPIVIIATREAIRSVPGIIREASFALGSTKWETVRFHVLPYSMSGILTGVIVSLSRAIGETAPLITIGALTYVAFLPEAPVQGSFPFVNFRWLDAPFTVLPIQMFNWISRPDRAFHDNAAAAGVVLITMTLGMNALAIALRYRLRKRINW